MTKQQMLLLLLMEEAAEVAQACSKVLRFGANHKPDVYPDTNADRLYKEIIDFQVIIDFLETEGVFKEITVELEKEMIRKQQSTTRYLSISKDLGHLDG